MLAPRGDLSGLMVEITPASDIIEPLIGVDGTKPFRARADSHDATMLGYTVGGKSDTIMWAEIDSIRVVK